MRINGIHVALILGGVLGVLAVVFIRVDDDRILDTEASAKSQPVAQVANKVMPDPTLQNSAGTESREIPSTVETDEETATGAGDYSKSTPETPSAVVLPDSAENQKIRSHDQTDRFRSSASVQERCLSRPAPTSESCKTMSKFLEALAREEPDVEWAAQTEARIRAVVSARQDGTQVRALECKRSICVIETESLGTERHLAILRQEEQEAAGIVDDGNYVLAWEEDPVRGTLTITAVAFTRRFQ